MDYNFGWNNAQNFYNDQERYLDYNSFQDFNAYQVNPFDCCNSYYPPYPPNIDCFYASENQCYDPYPCYDVDRSLVQYNSSLMSMGLFAHIDQPKFEVANKTDIICQDSISWYEENAKRNTFIMEVQLVMHNGCFRIPPCVDFPLCHDTYLAIDENFVSYESTCLDYNCPVLDNEKLDTTEILPDLVDNVVLNELVDEIKIDEYPILIEKDVLIDDFALEYKDPIWVEFMSHTYDDYSDDFSSYFDFSRSLEQVWSIQIFLYVCGSMIYLHIIIILLIRRYVHLFAFSPH